MRYAAIIAALVLGSATTAEAATVAAINARPTAIAELIAGRSYTVSVTGTADLYAVYDGGAGLPFYADGTPAYAFAGRYSPFMTNNMVDPTSGLHAQAAAFAFGSLVGSYTADPAAGDFFALRNGATLTAASNVTLFGLVNDTVYGDNAGGFQVTLSETPAVPEPATWAMMIGGFGLVGGAMRRRKAAVSFAY